MKKIVCALFSFLLAFSAICFAEELGTFVPSYQAFMDNFSAELTEINESYCDLISSANQDGKWNEVAGTMQDRFIPLNPNTILEMSTHEYWGQIVMFCLRMPCDSSDETAEEFTEIIKSACSSINQSFDESDIDTILRISSSVTNIDARADGKDRKPRTMFFGLHMFSSSIKDGYVYFYFEILHDEGNERYVITPYGYERK